MAQIRVEKRFLRHDDTWTDWYEVPFHVTQARFCLVELARLKAGATLSSRFAEYRIIPEDRKESEWDGNSTQGLIASDGSIAMPDDPEL